MSGEKSRADALCRSCFILDVPANQFMSLSSHTIMQLVVSDDHHGVFILVLLIYWKNLADLGGLGEDDRLSDAKRTLAVIRVTLRHESLPGD